MKQYVFLSALIVSGTFCNAQNVGIGTPAPSDQLHTTGTVRLQNYAGGGTRLVQIDNTGRLVITGNGAVFKAAPAAGIPDDGCTAGNALVSNITVSGQAASIISSKISVRVNIIHPSSQEVRIFLVSPAGQLLRLSNGAGSGANYTNTVFTDEATGFISNGSSPFTGKYKPSGGIAATCSFTPTVSTFTEFNGGTINPNGSWQLRVLDAQAAYGGSLQNWEISFAGPESFTTSEQANYLPKFQGGNLTNSSLYENPSTGNIGIGTTTPAYPFTLENTGDGLTQNDAFNGVAIGTYTNGSGAGLRTLTNDNLFFSTNSGPTQMILTTAGNVGIGVGGFPARKLDVGGTGRFQTATASPVLELNHSSALSLNQNIDINFRTPNYFTARIRSRGTGLNTSSLGFYTYAASDSAGLKERLTIDDGGNMGFNTISNEANKTFTVNGSLKITDGTQGAGKVLTSNASGTASWTAVPITTGYGFRATATPASSLSNNQLLCFCNETLDDGNVGSNGVYITPATGVYRFDLQVPIRNTSLAYPEDYTVRLESENSNGVITYMSQQTFHLENGETFKVNLSWMGSLTGTNYVAVRILDVSNRPTSVGTGENPRAILWDIKFIEPEAIKASLDKEYAFVQRLKILFKRLSTLLPYLSYSELLQT